MSQFYGTLRGQAKTTATRRGSAKSGITTVAASWKGAVEVTLYTDDDGNERYEVNLRPWHGQGPARHLATGILGQ